MAAVTRKSSRAALEKGRNAATSPGAKAVGGPATIDRRLQAARRASILLKHVSDPIRLEIILILAGGGERHVGALRVELAQGHSAVSHHLALLRHGGIIAPRRQGKNNFYGLTETGTDLAGIVKGLMTAPPGPAPDRRDDAEGESWGRMNRRRADLIFRKNRGGLDDAELTALDQLQSLSRARMHREFPAPDLFDERLRAIEEGLSGDEVNGRRRH